MPLTTAQQQTLKAYIASVPEWAALPNTFDSAFFIADELAKPATPTFVVWRTLLSRDDLRRAALAGAAEMDNLEAGKRDALFWMLSDSVNPSLASTRQAFTDLTANRSGGFVATALRASLTAAAKRSANVLEKLFATGTGTDASPATMTVEGRLNFQEVFDARALA